MKKIICLLFFCAGVSFSYGKEIQVVSFKQSISDIAARTNLREDTKGVPCALVKVQLPMRNAIFEGDIVGEIAFKINEYWVYMPQKSSHLEVRVAGYENLSVDFSKYGISGVESQGTYEMCLLKKEGEAPQLYEDGLIALAKNDVITGYRKLQKASNAGYAPASYELGLISIIPLDKGYDSADPNTEEGYQEAYNYLKDAADKGYPEAQYALSHLLKDYKNGKSETLSKIKIDSRLLGESEIKDLIRLAADKGVIEAQYLMLSDDQWCEQSASKGIAVAEFGMGLRYDKSFRQRENYPMLESLKYTLIEDNYNKAIGWYQKASDKGLDLAQWRLGDFYVLGLGVEKDINKAIALKTKAAEQGFYLFQYMMSMMYAIGIIGDFQVYRLYNTEPGTNPWEKIGKNTMKASYWLRKFNHQELRKYDLEMLETNGLYAMMLGILSENTLKEGKYEEAIYWYQRQMDMGYGDAYFYLGEMYMKGSGVSRNYKKARSLFEQVLADDKYGDGHDEELQAKAMCYLGIIYRDGLGIIKDTSKAKDYLMRAYSQSCGSSWSGKELIKLYEQLQNYTMARSINIDEDEGW